PFVVFAPWNAQAHYRWLEEHWIQLGRALLDRGLAASVVLVGGHDKREREHATRIVGACGRGAISLVGAFGLGRDVAILEQSKRVVSLDTGSAHLARAVGAPTVVLFGPGSPAVWCPPGAKAIQR